MSRVRHDLITRIWRGRDPFLDLPPNVQEVDLQGWRGEHPYLVEAVATVLPRYVAEVGAAKGGSAIVLARELKSRRVDGVVIAVDTFLGGATEWQADDMFESLGFEAGHCTLYARFANNILRFGLGNYVLPLTMDSTSAAALMTYLGVHPGVVHLDTSADYHSLMAQLHAWWSVLAPGGILIGGNYHPTSVYPEVKRAFDDFFAIQGHTQIEHREGKCRVTKTEAARQATAEPVSMPTPLHAPPPPPPEADLQPVPIMAEPVEMAQAEEPSIRRVTGSFRLGGRPVQLTDEQESASA